MNFLTLCLCYSISRLGAKHKNFALGAVYFLIDMTNDEMHQIRKNALKVLCQISAAYDVILTPLDLDDLNEVFHDIDPFVRYDLYTFLGAIRCSNNLVLTNMIRALRINLNLFKEDIQSIFKCVRKIAERNHDFVGAYLFFFVSFSYIHTQYSHIHLEYVNQKFI
ncbi:hypothetical protein HMI56_003016 [Coelomomyces lativittatus]|nr:hypothetical protein HMI56_003016 [Coelomomyces lativittatus]